MTLSVEVARLSDEAAVAALGAAGEKYVRGAVKDVPQLGTVIRAFIEMEDPTVLTIENDPKAAADLARLALNAMLEAGPVDPRAARLASEAIEAQKVVTGQAEPITTILVGSYFLALAVASKVSYSRNQGWKLNPGFPGLGNVLGKAAKLVSAIYPSASSKK